MLTPTWVGTGSAIAVGLLLLLPFMLLGWRRQPARRNLWAATVALALLFTAAFLLALVASAPSGDPGPDSPVRQRFADTGRFRRYSLANLVPESEQVNLGFHLMPYVDPLLTRAQAERALAPTLDLYREMENDDNFHALGSVMGLAYRGLLGHAPDAGHYYLYLPRQAEPGPLPALIFLHGAGGNFKVYTWIWSRLAEEMGFALIVPGYGFGTWDEDGATLVLQALADAGQVVALDQERVYLAGLSNGGVGVTRLAAAHPARFRGLIYLSPVMPAELLGADSFRREWAGRPVLVMSGADDRRIPAAYVRQRVAQLEEAGVEVSSVIFPGEDHFLIFSRPEQIRNEVAAWLAHLEETAPAASP